MTAIETALEKLHTRGWAYPVGIAALVGLAIWGHQTSWQMGSAVQPAEPLPLAWQGPVADVRLKPLPADQAKPLQLASPEAAAKAGIELVTASECPMEQFVVANGVVDYNRNHVAQLSIRVPGTVWRVEKQLGQPIRKGDVLAIIEAVDIGKAKADFLQAVVADELADQTLARLREVANSIPDRQVREAAAHARETHIRLHNAQQTLVNLGLPIRLNQIADLTDDERVELLHFLGLPKNIVETLDKETTTANLVALRAPFDGVVIGRDVTVGEVVSPSQTQFTLADVSQMWIKLDVRKEDANLIRIGQQIKFYDDSLPSEVTGTVDWISTAIDEQVRTLEVRAEVDNPVSPGSAAGSIVQRQLRAHAFGTGKIVVRRTSASVVIPSAALQTLDGQPVVFLRRGDAEFEPRAVEVGVKNGEVTEIMQGLEPGQLIAGHGSHVLKAEIERRRFATHVYQADPARP